MENSNPIDKIFDEVIEQQRSSDIDQRLHGRPIPTKQPKFEEKTRFEITLNGVIPEILIKKSCYSGVRQKTQFVFKDIADVIDRFSQANDLHLQCFH